MKKLFALALICLLVGGCGGGVHEAAGGLDIVKKHRKTGIVVIGGIRHLFDGPVDMEDAEKKASSQCGEWGYSNIELSSAKNVGSEETAVNTASALGAIMGGHSVARSVEIVYECY